MNRPGDWNCRACHHLNFQRRESCQRCGDPRPPAGDFYGGRGIAGASAFPFTGPDVRPGDWYCALPNCGAHNFASRSSCFKCGVAKDELAAAGDAEASRHRGLRFGGGGSRSGWKSGDWICSRKECNEHNFASRTECFKCSAPKEPTNQSPF
ncbi:uncharacterized protein LOC127255804 [Andrographis paniculata]|uniref:uncharacterized protein LOC127255804 n=1 Tax=Andrographis paniculata TaxID=175694 RepID=UPI0021E7E5F0|nr:uncharacterized protein LOC127255804 [Andrographis paniculata]